MSYKFVENPLIENLQQKVDFLEKLIDRELGKHVLDHSGYYQNLNLREIQLQNPLPQDQQARSAS